MVIFYLPAWVFSDCKARMGKELGSASWLTT